MEIVEKCLKIQENKNSMDVSETEIISDATIELIAEEFKFVEILNDSVEPKSDGKQCG